MAGGRHRALGALLLVVVGLAGCNDPMAVPRRSRLDGIDLTAVVAPDGSVRVEQRVRFLDGTGGLVQVPVRAGSSQLTDVTLDGQPVAPGPGDTEVRVDGAAATLGFTVRRAVSAWSDLAVLDLAVHADASDASRQDPPVPFRGTITLPEGAEGGDVVAHWQTALDREVVVSGRTVTLAGEVPAWAGSEVAIGFSPTVVRLSPDDTSVQAHVGPHRADFEAIQAQRDAATASLEATLDEQERLAGLVRPAFLGLAGVVLLFVVISTQRVRLAERRRRAKLDDDVPARVTEAPGSESPAVVALLVHDAERVDRGAVAGTVLHLAQRGVLEVRGITSQELVLHLPRQRPDVSDAEAIILDSLGRLGLDPAPDELRGPPVWAGRDDDLWGPFRKAVVTEARTAGLVDRAYKGSLFATYATIFVGCSWPAWIDLRAVYLLPVITIAGLILSIPILSHVTLTDQGVKRRARWLAYRRHLQEQRELRDVGAPGLVVWGDQLVYGAALGVATTAIPALSPPRGDEAVDVRRDTDDDAGPVVSDAP